MWSKGAQSPPLLVQRGLLRGQGAASLIPLFMRKKLGLGLRKQIKIIAMKLLNLLVSTSFSLLTLVCVQARDRNPSQGQTVPSASIYNKERPAKQYVRIALLLDTSNSMDGLIDQAKAQLWDIVNEFSRAKCGNGGRPELQIALYEYGNDNLPAQEGHIRQVLGFSGDLDEISQKLFSLTTNGGQEFCGQVIHSSLKQLEWGKNPDDLKMIFIAGNEPFDQGTLDFRDAGSQALEQDVVVNTIFCGNYQQGINSLWRDGATLSGGQYMAIDHNRHVVHIDSPYDKLIIELNARLNNTYISYGSMGREKKAMQYAQDNNAMELEEAVAVQRAVSKSSSLYKNSQWDLVDAVEADELVLEKLDSGALPASLQGKSAPQIKAIVEAKRIEREKIQKEIQELNAKREIYLAKNQGLEKGELENALMAAIRAQAAKKDYRWD